MKRIFIKTFCLILLISVWTQPQNKVSDITGLPSRTRLNANYISTVLKNTGISDIDVYETNSGFVFPKGSGLTAVFESGFLWGGKVPGDSVARIGGSAYREGLQGGKIISFGVAESPSEPHVRIYRVRSDVYPGGPAVDFSSELEDGEGTETEIRTQYEKDWLEWRATDGAPFEDKNGNGNYEPSIDVPGYPGAFQTIWFVANDLEPGLTQNLYGSMPIGIELQVTIWAYSINTPLDQVFFKQYRIINKSGELIDSMYISIWADCDIGNSTDDFAGCDTILNTGFTYNAQEHDFQYDYNPPAVGFKLLKGPVSSTGNLEMTSFNLISRGFGAPEIIQAHHIYNLMQGESYFGGVIINPLNGEITKFHSSGNPITGEGWVDGYDLAPGDRRTYVNSGPFQMADGDTQDVVFAEVAALGGGNIGAIKRLRYNSIIADSIYRNNFSFDPEIVFQFNASSIKIRQYYGSVFLNWQNNEINNLIENYEKDGYQFQGYNIYQSHSELHYPWTTEKLATFDKVDGVSKLYGTVMNPETGYPEYGIEQDGSDSGIKRNLSVDWDYLNDTYLIPGKKYYYTLNAYFYNPDPNAVHSNVEATVGYADIIFQENIAGPREGDSVNVSHFPGDGEMDIAVTVVDPYALTGHDYKVYFIPGEGVEVFWNLKDETTGEILLENQGGLLNDKVTAVIDGFQLDIYPLFLDVKRLSMISNGFGVITGAECTFEITQPPPNGIGVSADWYRDVALSLNGGALSGCYDPMQANGGYFFCVAAPPDIDDHQKAKERWTNSGENFPKLFRNKYSLKFTPTGGKGWMAFTTKNLVDVPFEIWFLNETLEDTTDDVRMIPWIMDDNENDTMDFKLDHKASGGNNDPYSDWIFFMMPEENAEPGEQAYYDAVARSNPGYDGSMEIEHIANFVLMNWNLSQGSGGVNELPDMGTTFLIEFPNPVTPGVDEFTFSTEKMDTLQYYKDYVLFQNYPNPFNSATTIEFKVAQKGIVQIDLFDILGQKVTTLMNREFDVGWYYFTFDASSLASGIYLYQMRVNNYVNTKKLVLVR